MSNLAELIKAELNREFKQADKIEIQDACKNFVWFFVDGNIDIINTVILTATGKVKKNSHRTQSNYAY